jgi:Rab GDP dissociation inhibitor
MVETNDPVSELKPAFDCIGDVLETFVTVSDLWEPIDNTFADNVFVTSSFDAVSHFEGDTDNVLELFKKITGKEVNFNTESEEGREN